MRVVVAQVYAFCCFPGDLFKPMRYCRYVTVWACFALFLFTSNALAQVQESGVKLGAQQFGRNCAACHGADGKGSEKAADIATTPRIVAMTDTDLVAIIHNGVPGTGMPPFPQIPPATAHAIVDYLRTLQGKTSGTPTADAKLNGDPKAGRALYFGKAQCSNCHMINGEGGFIASDMTTYGQSRSADAIRKAIITPDAQLAPNSRVVKVKTKSGQNLTGVVRNEDNMKMALQTEDGRYHFLTRSNLAEVHYTDHSLMPQDYGTRLTSKELDDIVSFLITTGKSAPAEPPPARRRRSGN